MPVDIFLKIEGIKGESKDDQYKEQIEVQSYSFGLTQAGTFAFGGGGGAGKAQFQDISFAARVSKASPMLFLKCANGQHLPGATLSARKAGERPLEFLQIKLNDVIITSYQNGGSSGSDSLPVDQFSINYAKIEFAYTEQKDDGSAGEVTRAAWDVKANTGG